MLFVMPRLRVDSVSHWRVAVVCSTSAGVEEGLPLQSIHHVGGRCATTDCNRHFRRLFSADLVVQLQCVTRKAHMQLTVMFARRGHSTPALTAQLILYIAKRASAHATTGHCPHDNAAAKVTTPRDASGELHQNHGARSNVVSALQWQAR